MAVTQPKVPSISMTSYGLMDLSAMRVKPAMKLAAMRCRPRPIPRPTAPLNTASVARLKPTICSAMSNAITGNMTLSILTIRAFREAQLVDGLDPLL